MQGERISVTVPKKVYKEIEKRRGDVPRSKFVSKIVSSHFFPGDDEDQSSLILS